MFKHLDHHKRGSNHGTHRHHNSSQEEVVKDALGNFLGAALDEMNYQAAKNRIIANIESLKVQALNQDALGNYSSAIALYDAALRDAGELDRIWARHQWHLGNRYSYGVCSHHSQHTSTINALRSAVVTKQEKEQNEVRRLRQLEDAKIREEQRLRDEEAARKREEQARLNWQMTRNTIPHQEVLKRAADAGLEQAQTVLSQLNPLWSTYNNSIPYHFGDDSNILRQLNDAKSRLDGLILQERQRVQSLHEAASDNQLQESIHRSMYMVLDALEAGDIPAALSVLSASKASARFHNTGNIKGQLCTPAAAFDTPLQELTKIAKEFKHSAKTDALNYAKRVTQLVQQSTINTTTPGKNRLYSSYEKEIETVIKENLEANWKNFHARPTPEDLIVKITTQIVERFKPIGNVRWAADIFTFTGWPNLSLIDYSALLLEIADSINKYVPLNPMQLKKPFLDTFLQPYIDERNKTRATVVLSDSGVPLASYAEEGQDGGQKGWLQYNFS